MGGIGKIIGTDICFKGHKNFLKIKRGYKY